MIGSMGIDHSGDLIIVQFMSDVTLKHLIID